MIYDYLFSTVLDFQMDFVLKKISLSLSLSIFFILLPVKFINFHKKIHELKMKRLFINKSNKTNFF